MTVFENIAFGLRVRPRIDRPSRAEIKDKVHELLRLIQLETLAQRYPSQLSGGQRQRIVIARICGPAALAIVISTRRTRLRAAISTTSTA